MITSTLQKILTGTATLQILTAKLLLETQNGTPAIGTQKIAANLMNHSGTRPPGKIISSARKNLVHLLLVLRNNRLYVLTQTNGQQTIGIATGRTMIVRQSLVMQIGTPATTTDHVKTRILSSIVLMITLTASKKTQSTTATTETKLTERTIHAIGSVTIVPVSVNP